MKKTFQRLISLLLVLALAAPGMPAAAAQPASVPADNGVDYDFTYSRYLEAYGGMPSGTASIPAQTAGEGDAATAGEALSYQVSVAQAGLYALSLQYGPSGQAVTQSYTVSLELDGKTPFFEAQSVKFFKRYQYASTEIRLDEFGNQLVPDRVEIDTVQSAYFRNYDGYDNEPYRFYLTEGTHTVTLTLRDGAMRVYGLAFQNEEPLPTYAQKREQWEREGAAPASGTLEVQGENAAFMNDQVLYAVNDSTSGATYPADPAHIMLNSIGGSNWSYPGQTITWKLPQVEQSGLYRIVLRLRQNYKRGVEVSRKIRINGEVPYRELENYHFSFSSKWQKVTLGDGGQPFCVYLEAGKENTLSMEAVASYPELMSALYQQVLRLNELYRSILMVVGTEPDTYQDYQLPQRISGFEETVASLMDSTRQVLVQMEASGFQKGGESAVVDRIVTQLKSFLDQPETVPFRMTDFQTNITSMADWVQKMQEQPLEVDVIYLVGMDTRQEPSADIGFFAQAAFTLRRLIASFTNDYSKLSSGSGGDAIEVWINTGREQAQILKNLTDNGFVADTGLKVNVNLVQQSLVAATLAGKGPDIAVNISPNDIVNLAARNALTDITRYGDYGETVGRFQKNSLVSYTYMDGVYALPFSENYLMQFYRTDILKDLGLSAPTDWDEFCRVLRILQRNHLQAGIPNTEIMFQTLLYQNGGAYYEDGWAKSGLNSQQAQAAFGQWTDFYTNYSLPVAYDFFSRFRTGEMPIGIAEYTMYGQFSVAAPEIKGLWQMTCVPGTVRADGSVDNTVVGSSSGAVIFQKAQDKEGVFAYLKWLTSESTQTQYAREVEAQMGVAARHPTANIAAFSSIGWSMDAKEILLSQWSNLSMAPQTPVNYYVSRNITNAFRGAVYKNQEPREILSHYVREIQLEIDRRRKAFGLS